MNTNDTKTSHPRATHYEIPADTDFPPNQSHIPNSRSSGEPQHARPGEAIMNSDDPSTAALRAWAKDKQMQVPGSNGSFALGQMSMGAGAVSGGPVFLPRKEYIVEPPFHSMDHGPVGILKGEQGKEEEEIVKKMKRRSISDLFRRKGKGKGKGAMETEVRVEDWGKGEE